MEEELKLIEEKIGRSNRSAAGEERVENSPWRRLLDVLVDRGEGGREKRRGIEERVRIQCVSTREKNEVMTIDYGFNERDGIMEVIKSCMRSRPYTNRGRSPRKINHGSEEKSRLLWIERVICNPGAVNFCFSFLI